MKKRRFLCLLTCIALVFVLCTSVSAETIIDPSVTNGCSTLDGTKPLLNHSFQVENATAAILYEVTTDTLLYTYNVDEQMYPSSLTKILTALIVIENSNLNDAVVVKQEVLNTVEIGAASAKLVADEVITVENLLYSMLVDSANDSAAVLADYVCGSQEAFVQKMNERVQEIGCTSTNFVNAHGLYNENHKSTARDIAKIIKEAIKNETFVEIFGTKYYTIPATNKSGERNLETGNFLMTRGDLQIYYDSRVTGGRTGAENAYTRCIATTSESGGMQMISVLMGAQSIYAEDNITTIAFGGFPETSDLLDCGYKGMAATRLFDSNQAVRQYTVENGDCDVVVCPQETVDTVLPENITSDDLTYKYSDLSANLKAPIEKGQLVSTVEVLYGNITIGQAELYAMNDVAVEESTQLPAQTGGDDGSVSVTAVILGVLAVLLLFFFGSRFARRLRLASRRKRVQNKQRRG